MPISAHSQKTNGAKLLKYARLFDGFYRLLPGADSGGWDEGYLFISLAVFNYVFDKYDFSAISNLFDKLKIA